MYLDWTKHLPKEDEKKDFEKTIRSAKTVLERELKILQEYEKSLERTELNIKVFEDPNWAYKQAYMNGYRSCLTKIQELINLDQ